MAEPESVPPEAAAGAPALRAVGGVTPQPLTQDQIDALVHPHAGLTLVREANEVTPYDFIRPPRVTKERRATLEAIYNRFSLSLQALLTSILRAPTDVSVSNVEQAMFSEFVLSLESPCAAFVFSAGDALETHGVIDLTAPFAFHLVDRMFGGPGDPLDLQRPLTTLEQTVVRGVSERSLALLREAWQENMTLAPQVVAFESNPEMLRITNLEDNVLVVTIEVRSGAFTGSLGLCLPLALFEPFLAERGNSRLIVARVPSGEHLAARARVQSALLSAHVTIAARLPAVRVPAGAIAELREGQTLLTGFPMDAPIEVQVNRRPRWFGQLGQLHKRVGVRITQSITAPAAERPVSATEGRIE